MLPLDRRTHVVLFARQTETLNDTVRAARHDFLRMCQGVLARNGVANLYVVTRDVADLSAAPALEHAVLTGMGRVCEST